MSFGEEPRAVLRILGEDGWLELDNAYRHDETVTLTLSRRGRRETLAFEPTNPFAAELAYFSSCILQDRAPEPSGIEGVAGRPTGRGDLPLGPRRPAGHLAAPGPSRGDARRAARPRKGLADHRQAG